MDEIDAIREARKEDAAFFERNPKVRDLVVDEVYPDKVHFIYELLQNAEDAGAKEVSFTLRDTELVFEHNGTRYFGREDVEAITKIAAGTKTSDSGKIGRFGIGFKSVFAFTETPQIWSPGHSFEIRNFVMPYKLDMIEEVKEGKITRFAFPFNGKKKAPNVAQKEIHDGLLEISEKTLLFLTGIESIKWAVIGGPSGEVLRIPHTTNHIEVLKQVNGEFSSGSHYLRFMEPAKVYPKQFVAIAFELNQLPSTEKNSDGRLDRNFTISSAKPGTVSVFFPAAKETSGLRFHIHAPFVPELSRASIRDIPENIPLIEQISGLAARSLADLREMGVLGVAALAVVPHNGDELPMRYQDIRNKMLAALRTQSLIPKHSGGHSPAMSLVRASTTVKQMISPADLRVILDSKTDLEWAVSVPKGSSQDQLFQSLQMPALDGDDLCGRLQKGTWSHDGPLVSWLSSKPGHWLQSLYAYLHKHIAGNYLAHQWKALMSEWHIVRSKNGAMRKGKECFFPSTLIDDGEALPPVDESTYCVKAEADGKWTSVEEPYTVLRWCGVSDVSEEDRLKVILRDRYSNDSDDPTWEEHIQDIGRLVRAFERSAAIAKLLSESHFIKSENGDWFRPDGIYLDAPFLETGLSEYFKAAPLEESLFLPSSEYLSEENGIPRQTFIRMLVAAGAQDRIALNTESCYSNPHRSALLNAPGGFSQKYHLAGLRPSPTRCRQAGRLWWMG